MGKHWTQRPATDAVSFKPTVRPGNPAASR
jgi:hypothetical protein